MNDKQITNLAFDADKRWQELKYPQAFVMKYPGYLFPFAVVAREHKHLDDCWSLQIFTENGEFVTNIATAILQSDRR